MEFKSILEKKLDMNFKLSCGSKHFANEIFINRLRKFIIVIGSLSVVFLILNLLILIFKKKDKIYKQRIDRDFTSSNVMMDEISMEEINNSS